jgi:hypothetical protein
LDQGALISEFCNAIENGQDVFGTFYDPTAIIWHNFDQLEKTARESADELQALHSMATIKFNLLKRYDHERGAIQQLAASITLPSGSHFVVHAAQFYSISNGLIVRLDEYADSAVLGKLALASSAEPG